MALATNALTTLASFKDFMGIPSTEVSKDSRYEFFINAASSVIQTFCERQFIQATHIERHDGRLSDTLVTREWPVQSVTEVRSAADWDFSNPASLYDANDFAVEKGSVIRLRNKLFPKGKLNVQVTYVSGFLPPGNLSSDLPPDLQLSCLQLSEWYLTIRDDRRIGVTNKSKSGENIGFVGDIPEFVRTILNNYRREEFAGSLSSSVGNG